MATKPKKYKPTDDNKKIKGKSYKADSIPFAELEENESVIGVFQGRRQIAIRDRRTKEMKDIWIYVFRDINNGNKFALSGRTMLDQGFEDMVEAEGGMEKIVGETIRVNRGDSIKTEGGNMGTYELILVS